MDKQRTGGGVVESLASHPSNPSTVYASTFRRLYKSVDAGASWVPTGLPGGPNLVLPTSDATVVRLFALTTAGLQVTYDGGASWSRLAPGLSDVSHLAIDPTDSRNLYLISRCRLPELGWRRDGEPRLRNFGRPLRGIVASRSPIVLVGSEGGISRSEDAGGQWNPANRGIRGVFVQSLAVDPMDPAVVFAAGSRTVFRTGDGGNTWDEPVPGSPEAGVVAIDPTDRSTLYAAGAGGVHKSADGGQTWRTRSLAEQIGELLIDPNNPRRLFAAYGSVYRSLDGADSWKNVMTPDDNYSTYYGGPPTVDAMALAPSDSSTIYAGGETGFLYRSTDGGDHWTSSMSVGLGIHALAIDSCDPRIVQAAEFDSVYRTIDGGTTWSPSPLPWDSGLPQGTVFVLARDPRHSSSVFAGTSQGVFWMNDRGLTWTRFEPALREPVHSIALDPSGRFLYAGTEAGVFGLERSFEPCGKGPDRLCLIGGKYQVSLTARRTGTAVSFPGRAIEEGDRFGYFSFPDVTGDPTFPEVFVKMVDASGAPPPYGGSVWVFHSSLTDLGYTLTVRETETGRVRTYDAADSESLTCGRADTSAFQRDCATAVSASRMPEARLAPGSGAELSLLSGRFRATIQARDSRTGRIAAGVAMARVDGFGYFSLPDFTGDPSFPEIFVKMVDATAQPGGYFWVFHTGLTDLEYTLTVTDQVTGAVRTYTGGATDGTRLCGSADTTAFRN